MSRKWFRADFSRSHASKPLKWLNNPNYFNLSLINVQLSIETILNNKHVNQWARASARKETGLLTNIIRCTAVFVTFNRSLETFRTSNANIWHDNLILSTKYFKYRRVTVICLNKKLNYNNVQLLQSTQFRYRPFTLERAIYCKVLAIFLDLVRQIPLNGYRKYSDNVRHLFKLLSGRSLWTGLKNMLIMLDIYLDFCPADPFERV